MADENLGYSSNSLTDWSIDDGCCCSENNSSEVDQISQTDQQCNSTVNFTQATGNEEKENMKYQLEIIKKRVCCLQEINRLLQYELDKSTQTNYVLEQYITCPYVLKKGKIQFPGKNDLEKRFKHMVKALHSMKADLKIVQNDKLSSLAIITQNT